MLNILIENFEDHFLNADDSNVIENCLSDELNAFRDTQHLEQNVIGQAAFEWDYDVIEEGFFDLLDPFMQQRSYIPLLFMRALRELDSFHPRYLKAMLFLEYGHYACLVNDYYNFHKTFIEQKYDLKACARLSQLKYASQFLAMYPRYMLIQNEFGSGAGTIFEIHRLITNISVTYGISRGVFIKWSQDGFKNFTLENYFQNAINTLCNYILFPILMASIFARVPADEIHLLKKAFGYLTLFAKLRCEKTAYLTRNLPTVDTFQQSGLLMMMFPGYFMLAGGITLEEKEIAKHPYRYPDIHEYYNQLTHKLKREFDDQLVSRIESVETKYFDLFLSELGKSGLFKDLSVSLSNCFKM